MYKRQLLHRPTGVRRAWDSVIGLWKDPPLAASSTDRTTDIALRTASPRVTFAKLGDPLEVPDLLSLQTTSFDWLLGNERWQERAAEAAAAGREDVPQTSGLADILEEISPIEDFAGNMSLSFRDHTFDDPKYTVEECKEKDLTYACLLYTSPSPRD